MVDSNAAAPSLDLAQVGSTAALMEVAVSSVGDAAAAGASVVDSSLKDRRQSNAEVSTEVGLTAFHCEPYKLRTGENHFGVPLFPKSKHTSPERNIFLSKLAVVPRAEPSP